MFYFWVMSLEIFSKHVTFVTSVRHCEIPYNSWSVWHIKIYDDFLMFSYFYAFEFFHRILEILKAWESFGWFANLLMEFWKWVLYFILYGFSSSHAILLNHFWPLLLNKSNKACMKLNDIHKVIKIFLISPNLVCVEKLQKKNITKSLQTQFIQSS